MYWYMSSIKYIPDSLHLEWKEGYHRTHPWIQDGAVTHSLSCSRNFDETIPVGHQKLSWRSLWHYRSDMQVLGHQPYQLSMVWSCSQLPRAVVVLLYWTSQLNVAGMGELPENSEYGTYAFRKTQSLHRLWLWVFCVYRTLDNFRGTDGTFPSLETCLFGSYGSNAQRHTKCPRFLGIPAVTQDVHRVLVGSHDHWCLQVCSPSNSHQTHQKLD